MPITKNEKTIVNTYFHYDFTTIEDEAHQLDFLLGGLKETYEKFDSYGWRQQLWKLTIAVTSVSNSREVDVETDFGFFVSALKQLIEEAWMVLETRNDVGFQHQYLSLNWVRNPYTSRMSLLDRENRYRISYFSRHAGQVTVLSLAESRNFFLVFEDFFQQLDVIRWMKLLDVWFEFATRDETIVSGGYDYSPLETYGQLLRLVEACYLVDNFRAEPSFYPPNEHLFDRDHVMLELDVETDDCYNPFMQLSRLFIESTLPEMRNSLAHWMDFAKHQEKLYAQNEPATLILLHSNMCKLLEIGWLISHTEEMPAYWLDRGKFDPDGNQGLINVAEEDCLFLSSKEKQSPKIALKSFYTKNLWFHDLRVDLKDALY